MKRYLFVPALFLIFANVEAQEPVTFTSNTSLVIIDTFVKDKDGKVVPDLKKGDFSILEDGKPQQIAVFDYQKLDIEDAAPTAVSSAAPKTPAPAAAPVAAPVAVVAPVAPTPADKPATVTANVTSTAGKAQPIIRYQDRRLVAMFFDFTTMAIADQARVQKNALDFIHTGMKPADLVSILMVSTGPLALAQDFTDNKESLEAVIKKFNVGEGSELADIAGSGDTSDDNTFSADQSEFDIFNTDRKLLNLETAAKMLAAFPEKKVLLYFTGGITQTGQDNQAQLLKVVNAAKKANVVIDPIDARGMTASAPGGDATQASGSGASLFGGSSGGGGGGGGRGGQSGGGRGGGANDTGLQTLSTLASDTGGRLFSEDNNLSVGMEKARDDISSYYILGYYSTNSKMDGKYRTVEVRMTNAALKNSKLDYRHGYFGEKDFKKFTSNDKEDQLSQALMLGDPITDLDLQGELNYFRLSRDRYFVPFSVKVPGAEIALAKSKGNAKTELEFIGQVMNEKDIQVGAVRDAMELKLSDQTVAQLNSRAIAYDTGFTLPPGKYSLKFLARENETGKMGTYQTKFTIPDLAPDTSAIKTSTIVLGSQRQSASTAVANATTDKKTIEANPLVSDGLKLIPSITRVFRKDQNLYVYMEVYDPTLGTDQRPSVAATLSFFRGKTKMFESEPVRLDSFIAQRGQTLPVRFQAPLSQLPTGRYTTQINLIDETGRKFGFQRAEIVVLPAQNAASAPATAPPGPGGSR